ncbi:MAG: rhodanese family protein [Novosphingobium sp.]
MSATLTPLSPAEVNARLANGQAVLVDIREADEFARSHIAGSQSHPLSRWEQSHLTLHPDADVVFTCRSGARTGGACDRLAARVSGAAFVLDGGIDAWSRAGLPLELNRKAPLEIMRQVQIAAGSLVLLGVILGFTLSSAWFGLSAFVGAGLTFAGISGFCGMARLLMLAPWNRARAA